MMIDFHTHIFPDDMAARAMEKLSANANVAADAPATLAALTESMDAAGVDKSV